MPVDMRSLTIGQEYERPDLAKLWDYEGYQAIARGVVTPSGDNKIVLFITQFNQESLTQYENNIDGDYLNIEGEINHANDERIINSQKSADLTYLFYREKDHQPFTFHGLVELEEFQRNTKSPSKFKFKILGQN